MLNNNDDNGGAFMTSDGDNKKDESSYEFQNISIASPPD